MRTKDFLGNEWDIDCMGCAIADGSMQVPGGFIQSTQHFFVHQDPANPLEGFIVIGSKRHIRSIAEMQDDEYEELSRLIRDTLCAIKKATQVEYLTIIQEERSIHFHVWFFPWTKEILDKYGSPSLSKIRNVMADLMKRTLNASEWKELETSINKIKGKIATKSLSTRE